MPQKKFWLYDWIDTFEIAEFGQAETLINDEGLLRDCRKGQPNSRPQEKK